MVFHPNQYLWRSYYSIMGITEAPEWLAITWLLLQFSENHKTASKSFEQLFMLGIEN